MSVSRDPMLVGCGLLKDSLKFSSNFIQVTIYVLENAIKMENSFLPIF